MARGQVSLSALLKELGRRGITSVLLEGGSQLNGAMLRAKLVDRIRLYIAPELLGGDDAKGLIGGSSSARLDQSLTLRHVRSRSVGRDIVVEGDV
jgi:diaminohydroxyphosphoribosylaminopyrimidine deaminase/5-amino-6-(5-phosphoribosylamino)uracil reductase